MSGRVVSLVKFVGTVWMVDSLLGGESILRRERDLAGVGVANLAGLNSSADCFMWLFCGWMNEELKGFCLLNRIEVYL